MNVPTPYVIAEKVIALSHPFAILYRFSRYADIRIKARGYL